MTSKDNVCRDFTDSKQCMTERITPINCSCCSDSLHGHTDLVMTLAVSADGCLILSGSKDNTAILWSLGEGIHDIHKVYTAYGHAQSVSAVCMSRWEIRLYTYYYLCTDTIFNPCVIGTVRLLSSSNHIATYLTMYIPRPLKQDNLKVMQHFMFKIVQLQLHFGF